MRLLILADDLTGAADSAARCHHAGLSAHVYLTPPSALPSGAVALSTDSRYLAPAEAAEQVRRLLAAFTPTSPVQWYKKIDSTLRGNIGAELEAMLTVLPLGAQPCAVVCPAFPAQGRGLTAGCLVYGQATAPALHLPTLLAAQTHLTVAALPLADVRTGVVLLAEKLFTAQQQGAQLLVVDAMTDADLATVLAAAQQALPAALFCGSAGLIEPLARERARNTPRTGQEDNERAHNSAVVRKPMLAVIGSGSSMAHRQLAALRQLSYVRCLELQPGASNRPTPEEIASTSGWALHLPQPAEQAVVEGITARRFVAQLTDMAMDWINMLQPETLLIVGGDTAVHLLQQLGIEQLTIIAELMPGIPLTAGRDASNRQWKIITKAGNFGDKMTLVSLFQAAK